MINRIDRAECDKLAADTFRLIWNYHCQHDMVEIDGERVGHIAEYDNDAVWIFAMHVRLRLSQVRMPYFPFRKQGVGKTESH